jgi:hypothetical protein
MSLNQKDLAQIAQLVAGMLQMAPAQVAAPTVAPVPAAHVPASVQVAPTVPSAPRPVPVVPNNAPTNAELYSKIGVRKDSRMTLPVGMFREYTRVVLIFPNGAEIAADKDVEGRGRISRKFALENSGAVAGQYLTYHPRGGGYFIVSVTGTPAPVSQVAPIAQNVPAAPVVSSFADSWARIFGGATAAPAAQTSQNGAAPEKVKKPRSAKQLANDERLRTEAKNRKAAAASGVVAAGTRADVASVPVTPMYAVPQTLPAGLPGFNQGARPVPVPNVGARQMQFAGVVPVPVK